jgi:hypothetical protein
MVCSLSWGWKINLETKSGKKFQLGSSSWWLMVMAPSSFSLHRTIVCRALVSASTTATTTTIRSRYIKACDTRSGLWFNSGYVLEQTHQQLCLSIIDSNSLFLLVFFTRHNQPPTLQNWWLLLPFLVSHLTAILLRSVSRYSGCH